MKTLIDRRWRGVAADARQSLPRRSDLLCRWFTWWLRGYVRKHFHAVRLSSGTRPRLDPDLPLIVVLNHPSWWDPLVGALLAALFPERAHYAPIDAAALERYRFFAKIGFYGVEQNSPRGALQFLRATSAILSLPASAAWITAQGEFTDARCRPVRLRGGVGHLASRLDRGVIVPLALEYVFWDERLPEALARFGTPLLISEGHELGPAQWVARVAAALEATQDALRGDALTRDPARFETLLGGRVGIGGVYDWWRRFRAWVGGKPFQATHRMAWKQHDSSRA